MVLRRPDNVRRPTNSMAAAATRVRLALPKDQLEKQLGRRQDWQELAWGYFDEVPEVKQSTWFLGNAMAKLRMYPATMAPGAEPDDDPVPVDDEATDLPEGLATAAVEEMERLRGEWGGQQGLLRTANMNLEIVGECYVVGTAERPAVLEDPIRGVKAKDAEPERWSVHSIREVKVRTDKPDAEGRPTLWVLDGPEDKDGRQLDADTDTVFRIWQPHPAWAKLADCAMRGVLGQCEALLIMDRHVRGKGRRRANAGILTLPQELTFGGDDPTSEDTGEEADYDRFMEELDKALVDPVTDEEATHGVRPFVIRAPGELLQYIKHITLAAGDDSVLADIEALVKRLARGLNLPVEVVLGHQQTTFANAEQVDQDTYEDHLESRAVLLADAFTVGYLRPQLMDRGTWRQEDVDRVLVWFDPSALVAQPDAAAAADTGLKEGVISEAAWRRVKGYSEEDAPDDAELARRAERQAQETQQQAQQLAAALVPALAQVLRPQVATESTAVAASGAVVAAARRKPNLGRQLMEVDRELRTRLLVLAEGTMLRAMERAGARLRTRAGKDLRGRLGKVEPWRIASVMGRQLVAATVPDDDLLAGAFDTMEEQFKAWGATAQRQALDLASKVIGGLSAADRDRLGLRQAENLDEAWAWTREALTALAAARLFDPDPALPATGEAVAGRVPPGLIRQSMARAGGAVGLEATDAGGAFLLLANGGTEAAGGIATGDLVDDLLHDAGAETEGYLWVYGPALRERPFEPHLELDGTEFGNFDDPVLANQDGWPPLPFYIPGDHDGCVCDFEPIIVPPGQ